MNIQDPRFSQKRTNPAVQLVINGKPIYLLNYMETLTFERKTKDMSGHKSSTKTTDKGIKAKELLINGLIPFEREEWLKQILQLAEAENGKGEQFAYRISSKTASVANMREVTFSGEVKFDSPMDVMGWVVSFTLREVNSVAEKKEQRKPKPKAKVQSENHPVATTEKPSFSMDDVGVKEAQKQRETSSDPAILGDIDRKLGGNSGGEREIYGIGDASKKASSSSSGGTREIAGI